MLLDIFDEDNSIIINCKAIKVFGLSTAAYFSTLIKIYKKAYKKKKLEDNYFKVDRDYIQSLLGMPIEEQLVCDANLIKISVLNKSTDDPNKIKLDLNMYLSILNDEDVTFIKDIRKQMKVMHPKGIKQTQRQLQINTLKNCIECSNYELLTALREWVDGVYTRPNGFLSKLAIKTFQNTLNNYTKGDLDLALKIVQIASIQGYRNCEWAINEYERSLKFKSENKTSLRVTPQSVAKEEDLSNQIF